MKVEVNTSVDICEKVHVSVEDITAALADYETELDRAATIDGVSHRRTVNAAKMLVTAAWKCLGAVQDDTIAEMPADHRELVCDALHNAAYRYAEPI